MKRQVKAHAIRFYHPDNVLTVHHMAYDPSTDQVAVLKKLQQRDEYCLIEIWSVSARMPALIKSMFVDSKHHSQLENVIWVKDSRLFSCGHDSCLNEHDLGNNSIGKSVTVGGGIVWCMDADSSRNNIVTGSDNGTISVFFVGDSSESISFGKVVGKCTSRVLSIVWPVDERRNYRIIAGSMDYITIWNYKKGTCVDKLDVRQRNVPRGETIVWSMAVSGNYLISGDSNGYTNVWNMTDRVNIKCIQSHEADILTVSADSEGNFFTSGVDPKISHFRINQNDVDHVHNYTVHRHDVKSLIITSNARLFSAGHGPYFVQSRIGHEKTRLSFLSFKSQIQLFESSLMFNYLNSLVVFDLSLEAEPVKSLAVNSKSSILSAAFNHSFVAYRTTSKLSILNRSPDHSGIAVVSHKFTEPVLSIDHMMIVNHNLVLVCGDRVVIMKLPDGRISSQIQLSSAPYYCFILKDKVVLILLNGKISVLDVETSLLMEMQRVDNRIVDHAFDSNETSSFWLLTANCKILSHNMRTPQISISNDVPLFRHVFLRGIVACKASLLLYSSDHIAAFKKEGLRDRETKGDMKHIVKIDVIGNKVLVIVELSDQELNKILPPKFDGKSTQSFNK
jgi:hypothetical protein